MSELSEILDNYRTSNPTFVKGKGYINHREQAETAIKQFYLSKLPKLEDRIDEILAKELGIEGKNVRFLIPRNERTAMYMAIIKAFEEALDNVS